MPCGRGNTWSNECDGGTSSHEKAPYDREEECELDEGLVLTAAWAELLVVLGIALYFVLRGRSP
jgi:hypothetical protein